MRIWHRRARTSRTGERRRPLQPSILSGRRRVEEFGAPARLPSCERSNWPALTLRAGFLAFEDSAQGVHAGGVELRPGGPDELGERLGRRPGRPVSARLDHRLEGVGDRNDPCSEWDLFATQSVRVAGAVETLVMRAHYGENVRQIEYMSKQALAGGGVALHCCPFDLREA